MSARSSSSSPRRTLSSLAVFGRALLAGPDKVGAAVPSSRALAARLARAVSLRGEGYVVELGAGTGSVTQALLERGVPPERLIAIELSEKMAGFLRERFPGVRVVRGDAARLSSLLHDELGLPRGSVKHIVSSLPLRSLPKPVVARIAAEVALVLGRRGRFIQFTYDLRPRTNAALAAFKRAHTSLVWFNLPPARVDVFHARTPQVS
jgi:phospholipid N-methyltransferase